MISSSAILGAVIGAFFGGRIIKQLGRRKSLVVCHSLTVLFVLPTIILNFYTLCFGRLGLGICGGIFLVALPRTIDETVPFNMLGSFGIATNLAINGGQMIGMIMGLALPDAYNYEGCKETYLWRIIFGFPWVLQFFTLLALLVWFKEEPIKYCIDNKRDDEALRHIKKVYSAD